jgi:osmotically-inducible protein OsmY
MSRIRSRMLVAAIAVLVSAGAALGTTSQSRQATSTLSLKDRIDFGLETSSVVRTYNIKVTVTGTEAILTGTVARDEQKAEAERLARVAGATRIQNAIVVDKNADVTVAERLKAGLTKTGERITDAWITTKVKWFFLGEDALRGSDIHVDTRDRVVTLKGTVRTTAARARAVELATDTEGVRRVIDMLTIAREP